MPPAARAGSAVLQRDHDPPGHGASWVDVEAILDHQVSDTTLRARRDEWIHAGVFEQLKAEALAAFDRIVGLDLDDVALDGSLSVQVLRAGLGRCEIWFQVNARR